MNVRMVDQAVEAIKQMDVSLVMVDASVSSGAGDRFVLELLGTADGPVVLALNKIDLIAKHRLLPIMDRYQKAYEFSALVPISARTGDGVSKLESVIWNLLPEGEPYYPEDYLTDQPERVIVAEMVREKLLAYTEKELPFSSAVVVDKFEEAGADGLMRLYCSIVVDRETHKPIVIGHRGIRIKQIGTEARQELERFFCTRVFLDLHVRVKRGWREDNRMLHELGLTK